MYIYLVGKPCSGKDTVSSFIKDEYGFQHLIAGKMVADYIESTYGIDSCEMQRFLAGYIVNDSHANELIKNEIQKLVDDKSDQSNNILFDGYPRTQNQLEYHFSYINHKIKKVFIILDISDEEAIQRMEKRVICSVCSKSQVYDNSNLCKFCMSEALYKRKDDNKEAMLVRIQEFAKKTNYIFNIQNNKNLNLHTVRINVNNKSIKEVLQEIDNVIQTIW